MDYYASYSTPFFFGDYALYILHIDDVKIWVAGVTASALPFSFFFLLKLIDHNLHQELFYTWLPFGIVHYNIIAFTAVKGHSKLLLPLVSWQEAETA